jgi:hypothetical protein
MRQAGVTVTTVTTSVGFAGNSSSSSGHGMAALAQGVPPQQQQQQQQGQLLMPELTAELDLPPMVPLLQSSSLGAAGTAVPMQQQQQMLSMPGFGMQPGQQHMQQSAAWQQQQQPHVPVGNRCSSMLSSFSSTGSAAQQHYAQQANAPQLQMAGSIGAAGPSMAATLAAAGAAIHNSVSHAPAVTHVLSARMASCDLKEALQLARRAAAAQGVTDLPGALRQMSSAQLPVITTASGSSLQSQQQQQQPSSAGTASSSGILQGHGSGGVSFCGVSSMAAAPSISGPAPLRQASLQAAANLAITEQAAAAAGSPTKHGLIADAGVAPAALGAAAAPSNKRARTSSLHDDGAAQLNSSC